MFSGVSETAKAAYATIGIPMAQGEVFCIRDEKARKPERLKRPTKVRERQGGVYMDKSRDRGQQF